MPLQSSASMPYCAVERLRNIGAIWEAGMR